MKKLFTLFFALLCLVMGVSTAQAQTENFIELATNNSWASFAATDGDYSVDNTRCTAYVATGISNGVINLVSIDVIPQGVGVFIQAVNSRKSPKVTKLDTTGATLNYDNWIVGCVTSKAYLTSVDNAYVIAHVTTGSGNGTGNYDGVMKINTVNKKVEVPVGNAYFVDRTNSGAKSFVFSVETDGIENVDVAESVKSVEYFNLAGQKVDSNCKGVVIGSNGKKYLNK